MDTLEVLRGARELITPPEKWMQGGYSDGGRFCMLGACGWAFGGGSLVAALKFGHEPSALEPVLELLDRVVGDDDLAYEWNDDPERTHAEVLAAFDRAIAIEEAKRAEFTVSENETTCELVAA